MRALTLFLLAGAAGLTLSAAPGLAAAPDASVRVPAQAQILPPETDDPQLFEPVPLDPDAPAPPAPPAEAPAAGETADAKPAKPDLDTLFDSLRTATGERARARIAQQIQLMWARSGSDTVDLLMSRAGSALEKKEPQLALDLLDAVVRFKPDYAAGWNRRAAANFMAGHLGRAVVDIERTLALEPRHWGALTGLATIQKALDDEPGALATFERILSIYPEQEKAAKAAEDLRKKTGGNEI